MRNTVGCVYFSKRENYDINYSRLIDDYLSQILWPWSFILKGGNMSGMLVKNLDYRCIYEISKETNFSFAYFIFIVNHLSPLLFQYIIVFAISNGKFLQAILPVIIYLIQKLMVSFKYAFLTDEEYNCLTAIPFEEFYKIGLYQQQLQLISGWTTLNNVLLEWEINRVSDMAGGDGNSIEFTISEAQYDRWKLFFKSLGINENEAMRPIQSSRNIDHMKKSNTQESLKERMNSSVESCKSEASSATNQDAAAINIKVLAKAIHRRVEREPDIKRTFQVYDRLAIVLEIVIIYLIWHDALMGHTSLEAAFIIFDISKTFLILCFFVPVIFFTKAAHADVSKRLYIAIMLKDLIRVDNIADKDLNMMRKINEKGNSSHKYRGKKTLLKTKSYELDKIADKSSSYDKEDVRVELKREPFRKLKGRRSVHELKKPSTNTVPIPVLPVSFTNNDDTKVALELPLSWQDHTKEGRARRRSSLPTSIAVTKESCSDERMKLYVEERTITNEAIIREKIRLRDEDKRKTKKVLQNAIINDDIFIDMPPISLDRISNISAWHYMRTICLRMGGRHSMRINILLTMILFITFVIVALAVLYIFGMAARSESAIDFSAIGELTIVMFVVMASFICIIFTGATANYEYRMHRQTLIFNALRNESKSMWAYRQLINFEDYRRDIEKVIALRNSAFSQEDSDEEVDSTSEQESLKEITEAINDLSKLIKRLNVAVESINHVNDTLEVSNTIHPVKVCGIRCDTTLVSTLITGIVTVLSTIMQRE